MPAIVAIVVVSLPSAERPAGHVGRAAGLKNASSGSVAVCALTQAILPATKHWYGPENSIHIEVLSPRPSSSGC